LYFADDLVLMTGAEKESSDAGDQRIPMFGDNSMKMDLTMVKRSAATKSVKTKKMPPVPLAKGQLWKMDDKHIEIMEVGKTLTHYRLFQSQKRVPISLGGITAVQAYLKTNGARLIRKAAVVKAA
jgi:hypothetical protein